MRDWTTEELDKIGAARELQVAALRPDGSLRPYTTIWVVRTGGDMYVRSYRGRDADLVVAPGARATTRQLLAR